MTMLARSLFQGFPYNNLMLKMTSLFLLASITLPASADPHAIYGEDNRKDVWAVSNPLYLRLAQSTAAMIDKYNLKLQGSETLIVGRSIGEVFKLCPNERFIKQTMAATCSGTLVAPDLIMTAAHCYEYAKETCKENVWVFDYKISKENQTQVMVSNSKIYECESVLLKEMSLPQRIDHALIKLKRPVTDRPFAKFRSQGSLKLNDPLVLIGHPSGLPTKIADDGYVLSMSENSFVTNLDAFTVNSGSGVFHAKTGEVEGILSSGNKDYDGKSECSSAVKYSMPSGNEIVMRPTKIIKFLETYKSP